MHGRIRPNWVMFWHWPNNFQKLLLYLQKREASKQEIIDLTAPLIQHALQSFGIYRLMFASNFPMDRVSTSLVNLIDATSDIVAAYHPNALQQVFHHNAKQFYRL